MAGKHISIPALLKIGAGALDNLGIYLKELQLQKVVVLFGNGLVEMFGSTVMEALQQEDIDILEYQELDTVRLEDLTSLAFSMPAKTQAVIGIGGGKVIDGAKYCGFLRNLPFISIPDIGIERWLFKCQCFPSGGGAAQVRSGETCIWDCGGYKDYPQCTREIFIFRNRRYGIKNYGTV